MSFKKGMVVKVKKGTWQNFADSGVEVSFNDDELLVVKKIDDTNGPRYVYVETEEKDVPWLMNWQVEKATDRETLLFYTHGRKALTEELKGPGLTCPKCKNDKATALCNSLVGQCTNYKYDYVCCDCVIGFWSGGEDFESIEGKVKFVGE